MSSKIATSIPTEELQQAAARRPWRALAVQLLGPVTIVAGLVWAVAQPYRIVLFDRAGRVRTTTSSRRRSSSCSSELSSRCASPRAWSPISRRRIAVVPRAETAHWIAAAVALLIGLILIAEVIVGPEVFRRRAWRAYLFPSIVVASSVLLWVITVFSTFSTMHLLAHAIWAQAALVAGAVELAVVRGKLTNPRWSLVPALALLASGVAFLVHEPNPWLYSRSAFLHHAIGWSLVVVSLFPLGRALQPRAHVWRVGYALTFVLLALLLFADRDAAPIFGRFGLGGP